MDRWHILSALNYLPNSQEFKIISSKVPELNDDELIKNDYALQILPGKDFMNGDISTLMSPRTVLSWAQNFIIFNDIEDSFAVSFLNKM